MKNKALIGALALALALSASTPAFAAAKVSSTTAKTEATVRNR